MTMAHMTDVVYKIEIPSSITRIEILHFSFDNVKWFAMSN